METWSGCSLQPAALKDSCPSPAGFHECNSFRECTPLSLSSSPTALLPETIMGLGQVPLLHFKQTVWSTCVAPQCGLLLVSVLQQAWDIMALETATRAINMTSSRMWLHSPARTAPADTPLLQVGHWPEQKRNSGLPGPWACPAPFDLSLVAAGGVMARATSTATSTSTTTTRTALTLPPTPSPALSPSLGTRACPHGLCTRTLPSKRTGVGSPT